MYIPSSRERVEITGRSGAFLVVRVDNDAQCAYLISLAGIVYLEENVPFFVLKPYREAVPLEIE